MDIVMIWTVIFLGAVAAGMIQSVTGFGAGIVLVILLSGFFSLPVSSSINTAICMGITVFLTLKYRKSIDLRLMSVPLVCYLSVSVNLIRAIENFNLTELSICFGLFLMALGLYFLVLEDKIHLKNSAAAGAVCGLISGVLSGLFGIGGPTMGLYLVTVTDNREKYLGTIQCFFTITGVVNMITRISCGIFTAEQVPTVLFGVAGILLGAVIGTKITQKMNIQKLKKSVYVFVVFAGLLVIVKNSIVLLHT